MGLPESVLSPIRRTVLEVDGVEVFNLNMLVKTNLREP